MFFIKTPLCLLCLNLDICSRRFLMWILPSVTTAFIILHSVTHARKDTTTEPSSNDTTNEHSSLDTTTEHSSKDTTTEHSSKDSNTTDGNNDDSTVSSGHQEDHTTEYSSSDDTTETEVTEASTEPLPGTTEVFRAFELNSELANS
jgi:hypothetical protein